MKNFKELQLEAFQTSAEHGFHSQAHNCAEKLALIHSEVSECLEEARREDFDATKVYFREDGKPEGYPTELADAVIRCMDEAQFHGIDLELAIHQKMLFNKSRPPKHGKAF